MSRAIWTAVFTVALMGSATALRLNFTSEHLCMAAIAAANGHKVEFIRHTSAETVGETIWITYRRPSDGKIWRYPCQVRGDEIAIAFTPGATPQFDGNRRIVWSIERLDLTITETVMGSTIRTHFNLGNLPRPVPRF